MGIETPVLMRGKALYLAVAVKLLVGDY